MEKPITIKRAEFNTKLAQAINESGLPAFVIVDCLTACMRKLKELEQLQYQNDLKAFEEAQTETKE